MCNKATPSTVAQSSPHAHTSEIVASGIGALIISLIELTEPDVTVEQCSFEVCNDTFADDYRTLEKNAGTPFKVLVTHPTEKGGTTSDPCLIRQYQDFPAGTLEDAQYELLRRLAGRYI